MKNQLLLLLTCIVIGALNTFSFAQTETEIALQFTKVANDDTPDPHNSHRGDPCFPLPITVYLDNESNELIYTTKEIIQNTEFCIQGIDGHIYLQGQICLSAKMHKKISLAFLDAGHYNLLVKIDKSLYAARLYIPSP